MIGVMAVASEPLLPEDPVHFRHVLGHYPTGVCAVTALLEDDRPVGMTVGSFTSVSLEPPLVAFYPTRRSRTWAMIAATGRFCVNILARDQADLAGRFATRPMEILQDVHWRRSDGGFPVIDGIVGALECDLHVVHEIGDHYAVYGLVRRFEVDPGRHPLLFCRGAYGGLS